MAQEQLGRSAAAERGAESPGMIHVVVDPTTLRQSGTGGITGQLFLRCPAGALPDDAWSDFPVVVLSWWLDGLVDLVTGRSSSFQGSFMDGPFAYSIALEMGAAGTLYWRERGVESRVGTVSIHAFLESVARASELVLGSCRARGWISLELDRLEHAISRATA